MFFIRAAFWLTLVIALIPVRGADLGEGQRPVSAGETAGMIRAAAQDISGFCERNSSACDTGRQLASQMGAKAREGARLAYTWLDERYGQNGPAVAEADDKPRPSLDTLSTGSTTQP